MSLRFAPTPFGGADGDLAEATRAQRGRRPDPRLGAALLAEDAARRARDLLVSGEAIAVTTGQQAGLFTGPLYGVLKGLSAAAVARALSARGHPHVPVFWVAGDDHDFAEINHCTVLDREGRPARITLRERSAEAPMLPAYREAVGEDGARALDELNAHLPPGDFADETLAWLHRAYAPSSSLAEAYARAMADLLGPYGVVVARGWDGSLKAAAADVMLRAARQAEALDKALAAGRDALLARGGTAPVPVGEGLALVMLETPEGRDRLRLAGAGTFVTRRGAHRVTLAELERVAATSPERLSGNVLLRPVLEAAVFPTVAYLGGPGELAYLAQTGPVFELLGVPRPARLPRLSGFLVEAKVDKVLAHYGLVPADLAADAGALGARLVREHLPGGAVAALEALRAAISERYAALMAEAAAVDPTLERTVESARNQALAGSHAIEKKLIAALKRANETAIRQLARARDQLYPEGAPQERVLTAASFLARHGRAVLALLGDAAGAHAGRLLEGPAGGA